MQDRVITVDIGRRFDPQGLIIGQHEDCDYRLDDEFVSTRHARLTMNSMGVVYVEDLGSTNGTFVNGVSIWAKQLIAAPGCILRVGHTDIEVRLVDDWLFRVTSDSMHET